MKIHEYQAKDIFKRYGVRVPIGKPAFNPDEAYEIAKEIISQTGSNQVIIKAQIHAGGRGKGGGIKKAYSPEEARTIASQMLNMKLITPQTGPKGKEVKRLLIEQAIEIERELYLGMVIDREQAKVVLMGSSEGGVEIEEIAQERPEKILKEYLDPSLGLLPYQARRLCFGLDLKGELLKQSVKFMLSLANLFEREDCSLAEINPLVVTKDQTLLALDAKINFDDNALFRHPSHRELRDIEEEDPQEAEAADAGVSYINLEGNIGCLVNGAGLAMSTMDIIKYFGDEPKNFLDVGGGANISQVTTGFKLILSDPKVKAILVNIFGGIMKCDTIAQGVIAAVRELGLKVPLVVRLEGTNVEKGREILSQSGLNIVIAHNMTEAAEKVVTLAKGDQQ
jgi:succinyl-CoA synthetase beta subunit